MAERALREQGTALNQRFSRIETDVRTLRLIAQRGAVRTGDKVGILLPAAPTVYNVMVNVTVASGRWQVFGQCTLVLNGVTAVEEQFVMSLLAYDAETSEYIDNDNIFDNPSAFAWFSPTTTTPAGQTMNTLADLNHDRSVMIVLAVANIHGSPFYALEPRLRLLPV